MAIFLRRALSFRNVLLLRSSAIVGRELFQCKSEAPQRILSHSALEFVKESRRGFAKGRNKSKDDSAAGTIEVLPNMGPTIKANTTSQMEAAITALSAELSKLRTGRASPGTFSISRLSNLLDHIIVETGGVKLPLSQIAVVSVLDSKTLSINPFDPNALQKLETAIVESALGLNPKVDGDRLIAAIPPLTKEHVQAVCKVVTKSCEDGRLSIRRARQKAMDTIKKLYSRYPKDDLKRLEKEVEELTKKFVKTAEDLCKAKEKEISAG
ncbi:PREDICTED: LOW QUALITY PROTEIN: ribosome-recycling factor [Prunus mume]|uniref:Ribosome-recycling factor, chloroplastic n=1 Tax=Prunus mume TaxID=102107 RepID=A0ABM0NX84_PRUMU|nr:PREDICTED: LOW QUALITY PROTEIN: ribosome-recycling factor [Prunus mume]